MDFGFLRRKPLPIIGESDLKRSVVEIVLTENEEVVFEVRSVIIAYQPGDICLPGGEVEGGETPEEAVVRELMEELRVNKDQIREAKYDAEGTIAEGTIKRIRRYTYDSVGSN